MPRALSFTKGAGVGSSQGVNRIFKVGEAGDSRKQVT